jgi:hypothetical protein
VIGMTAPPAIPVDVEVDCGDEPPSPPREVVGGGVVSPGPAPVGVEGPLLPDPFVGEPPEPPVDAPPGAPVGVAAAPLMHHFEDAAAEALEICRPWQAGAMQDLRVVLVSHASIIDRPLPRRDGITVPSKRDVVLTTQMD